MYTPVKVLVGCVVLLLSEPYGHVRVHFVEQEDAHCGQTANGEVEPEECARALLREPKRRADGVLVSQEIPSEDDIPAHRQEVDHFEEILPDHAGRALHLCHFGVGVHHRRADEFWA